jgi:hypothetical protein
MVIGEGLLVHDSKLTFEPFRGGALPPTMFLKSSRQITRHADVECAVRKLQGIDLDCRHGRE